MQGLEWDRQGRVRRPIGRSGDYVRLTGGVVIAEPNPIRAMVDDLVRRFDPGGYTLSCPMVGCGWLLRVPRMELDPEPLDAGAGDWVTHVEAVPRDTVELILRNHLDWHAALTETGAADVPEPPAPDWARCDLDMLHDGQDEACVTGTDEPEGWRIP